MATAALVTELGAILRGIFGGDEEKVDSNDPTSILTKGTLDQLVCRILKGVKDDGGNVNSAVLVKQCCRIAKIRVDTNNNLPYLNRVGQAISADEADCLHLRSLWELGFLDSTWRRYFHKRFIRPETKPFVSTVVGEFLIDHLFEPNGVPLPKDVLPFPVRAYFHFATKLRRANDNVMTHVVGTANVFESSNAIVAAIVQFGCELIPGQAAPVDKWRRRLSRFAAVNPDFGWHIQFLTKLFADQMVGDSATMTMRAVEHRGNATDLAAADGFMVAWVSNYFTDTGVQWSTFLESVGADNLLQCRPLLFALFHLRHLGSPKYMIDAPRRNADQRVNALSALYSLLILVSDETNVDLPTFSEWLLAVGTGFVDADMVEEVANVVIAQCATFPKIFESGQRLDALCVAVVRAACGNVLRLNHDMYKYLLGAEKVSLALVAAAFDAGVSIPGLNGYGTDDAERLPLLQATFRDQPTPMPMQRLVFARRLTVYDSALFDGGISLQNSALLNINGTPHRGGPPPAEDDVEYAQRLDADGPDVPDEPMSPDLTLRQDTVKKLATLFDALPSSSSLSSSSLDVSFKSSSSSSVSSLDGDEDGDEAALPIDRFAEDLPDDDADLFKQAIPRKQMYGRLLESIKLRLQNKRVMNASLQETSTFGHINVHVYDGNDLVTSINESNKNEFAAIIKLMDAQEKLAGGVDKTRRRPTDTVPAALVTVRSDTNSDGAVVRQQFRAFLYELATEFSATPVIFYMCFNQDERVLITEVSTWPTFDYIYTFHTAKSERVFRLTSLAAYALLEADESLLKEKPTFLEDLITYFPENLLDFENEESQDPSGDNYLSEIGKLVGLPPAIAQKITFECVRARRFADTDERLKTIKNRLTFLERTRGRGYSMPLFMRVNNLSLLPPNLFTLMRNYLLRYASHYRSIVVLADENPDPILADKDPVASQFVIRTRMQVHLRDGDKRVMLWTPAPLKEWFDFASDSPQDVGRPTKKVDVNFKFS